MNKLDLLFSRKQSQILNVYCTAGFPDLESTPEVLLALQAGGADIIEVGMPYSDPIADGPVIQKSNMQALENGITIQKTFEQLRSVKALLETPIILMGYLNPVLQFGIERFCSEASSAGVSGVILPDMPMYEFAEYYQATFLKYQLHFILLITPETSVERIRKADILSKGFLYVVSMSATTGNTAPGKDQQRYFKKVAAMKLANPLLVGFGIKDKESFDSVCEFANGAIVGSAYIEALTKPGSIANLTSEFISRMKGS